ncbi:ecto-ADP-ribosyltransferase 4-like isoform X2 [Cyclopterus lumpus]|uniref:ecto-ADP-ribosyltransferase 4-like isoform X2 n=1 Tax=Cyclopterus lumpus TaxID=8103 RepID=UPI001486D90E|nr:ecto-ADP-ribosyltransferase 4-like isoform X2 [Cyclopterus lumpus]
MLLRLSPWKNMKSVKGPVCELKSLRNWATLCVFLAGLLLLYHDQSPLLWWPQKPAEKTKTAGFRLDMATDCIDDMYDGCNSETASVIDLFGVFEWHFSQNFSIGWDSAEGDAKKPVHKHLKKEHATVIYMYTQMNNIQQEFDQAVKTGKHNYSTHRFNFHYLYFYLTDAIQVLRRNQTSCRSTFHRTRKHFERNVINTNMRFGAFIWAASSKQSFDLKANVSCFEIYSCFGADITYYSATNQMGQVLIPPYEVFKITDVLTDDPWCSVVYKLQSTEVPTRDLNCKLNRRQTQTYVGAFLTHWHESRVGVMAVCLMLLVIISVVLVKHRQKRFVAAVLGALLVLMVIFVILSVSQ